MMVNPMVNPMIGWSTVMKRTNSWNKAFQDVPRAVAFLSPPQLNSQDVYSLMILAVFPGDYAFPGSRAASKVLRVCLDVGSC